MVLMAPPPTTSSETLGKLAGVSKDTTESLPLTELVYAISRSNPSNHPLIEYDLLSGKTPRPRNRALGTSFSLQQTHQSPAVGAAQNETNEFE